MVHLAGGSLYGLLARAVNRITPWASKQSQTVAKSDIIRLEKAQPKPAVIAVAPKKPQVKPPPPRRLPARLAAAVIAPVENHHEIATSPSTRRGRRRLRGRGVAEMPHVVKPAAAPKTPNSNTIRKIRSRSSTANFSKPSIHRTKRRSRQIRRWRPRRK